MSNCASRAELRTVHNCAFRVELRTVHVKLRLRVKLRTVHVKLRAFRVKLRTVHVKLRASRVELRTFHVKLRAHPQIRMMATYPAECSNSSNVSMILYGDRSLRGLPSKKSTANLTDLIWFVFKPLCKNKKIYLQKHPGFVQAARSRELDRPRRRSIGERVMFELIRESMIAASVARQVQVVCVHQNAQQTLDYVFHLFQSSDDSAFLNLISPRLQALRLRPLFTCKAGMVQFLFEGWRGLDHTPGGHCTETRARNDKRGDNDSTIQRRSHRARDSVEFACYIHNTTSTLKTKHLNI